MSQVVGCLGGTPGRIRTWDPRLRRPLQDFCKPLSDNHLQLSTYDSDSNSDSCDVLPSDLVIVVRLWSTLPGEVKQGILAMVKATSGQG